MAHRGDGLSDIFENDVLVRGCLTAGCFKGDGSGLSNVGTTLTLGTDNQIPFMNAAGDDFEYSSKLIFDGTDMHIKYDGAKLYFGSTDQSSIYYDNAETRLIISSAMKCNASGIFSGVQSTTYGSTGEPNSITIDEDGNIRFNQYTTAGFLIVDTSGNITSDTSTYLKTDCSNDPLTGNLEISKADPELRLTDTGDDEYTRWTYTDTNHEGKILARLNESVSAQAIDCETSDYVRMGTQNLANGLGAWSLSFWWNPETLSGNAEGIMWSANFMGVYKRTNNDLWFYIAGNILQAITAAQHGITGGSGWHHIMITWDKTVESGRYNIFIDGTKFGSSTSTSNTDQTNYFYLNAISGAQTGDARFDQMFMWSKKMSDNDVADIYNSGSGRFLDATTVLPTDSTTVGTNLIAAWDFNGDVTDLLGANDGTVSGSPTYVTGKTPASTITTEKQILSYKDDTGVNDQAGESSWGDTGMLLKLNGQEIEVYLDGVEKYKILDTTGAMVMPDNQATYWGTAKDASIMYDGTDAQFSVSSGDFIFDSNIDAGSNYGTFGNVRFLGYTTSTSTPSTTELPNDKDMAIHKDSMTGILYLAFNDGGSTIKSVVMT